MSDRAAGMPRAAMIVLAEAAPGRLGELVDWYRQHHLPEVLAIPGFAGADQYVPLEPAGPDGPDRVLTMYRFDSDDIDAPICALAARRPTMTETSALGAATVWTAHVHPRAVTSTERPPESDNEVRR